VRGITISRRPNNRASSDSAPGPVKTIARAAATAKDASRLDSKVLAAIPLRNGRMALHSPMIAAATGVRNPSTTNSPLPIARPAITQSKTVAWPLAFRNTAASTIANAPSVMRNRSSPTPGHPPGNVEKSLCSSLLLIPDYRVAARYESLDVGVRGYHLWVIKAE
jgi:hypothetical protein